MYIFLAQNDNLPIHEDKSRGVYVKGLLEVYVSSIEEVFEVMKKGQESRVVSFTSKLGIFHDFSPFKNFQFNIINQ